MRAAFCVILSVLCLGLSSSCRLFDQHPHQSPRRPITLRIRCADADTAETLPAWAAVFGPSGVSVPPNDSPMLFTIPENVFLFEESCDIQVPEGAVTIEAQKGFDYAVARKTIQASSGQHDITIPLKRIANPQSQGWYCATAHLHMRPSRRDPLYDHDTLVDMMTWWPAAGGYDVLINHAMGVGEEGLPRDVWGWNADYFPAGRWHPPEPVRYGTLYDMGEEFRANPEGHVLFWDLQSYVEPGSAGNESYAVVAHNTPLVVDAAQTCLDQGGYFAFAHSGGGNSFEVSVCLGQCSAINMGDLSFQYERWYRTLNAGFRVAVVAGSDFMFPNGARFYAKVTGRLTWDTWMDAVRRGRTFATSGPILFARIGGCDPGEELRLSSPADLSVCLQVVSKYDFHAAQIIINGEVFDSFLTYGDRKSLSVNTSVPIARSSWIGVRTIGYPGEDMTWGESINSPVKPQLMRQSHTTPVYCVVGDQPIGTIEDLEAISRWNQQFYRDWIETEASFSEKSDLERGLQHFDRAQAIIARMIEERQ